MSKFTKVQDVLRFKDSGPSVEDARKAMLEAGEAPSGIASESGKNAKVGAVIPAAPVVAKPAAAAAAPAPAATPDFEDLLPDPDESVVTETKHVVPPPAAPAAAAPAPAATPDQKPPEKPKVEQFENDKFVGKIYQEKGQWVAEISYKNGSGTEKWTRPTKNELLVALLEGKGNATLRVKEAVRREKLGGPKLDKAYQLPPYVSTEKFEKMSPEEQGALIDDIAARNCYTFMDLHPEFLKTKKNGEKLFEYCKENDLAITVNNLAYALESLLEEGELETKTSKPVTPAPSSATPEPAARVEDSAPPAPAAPAVSTAAAATAAPAAPVRKRGTSGLQPGQSSVPSGDDRPEDGGKPRDLSEAELRKLPMADLKRIATADRRAKSTVQR